MIRVWMGNNPIIHMIVMLLYDCANKVCHSGYTAVNDGKGVCCLNRPKTKLCCGGAVIAILCDDRFSGSETLSNTVIFPGLSFIKQNYQYHTGNKNNGGAAVQFFSSVV